MEFEFDAAKSASNLRTHGIDFVDAQAIWKDPDRLDIPAQSVDEPGAGDRSCRKAGLVRVRHVSRRPDPNDLS